MKPIEYHRGPWAIQEDALKAIAAFFAGGGAAAAQPQAENRPQAASQRIRSTGGVAVLSLRGIITPRPSILDIIFGGGSGGLMSFRSALREAVGSDEVSSILIDIDSPGGVADLITETAAEIRSARDQKSVTAIANTMAGSAAYWLASQAEEIIVTPSGSVGSVGVFAVHDDWSGFNERLGVQPTYVQAELSPHKTELNPDEPLSDGGREAMQEMVDECAEMFVADVASGRGVKPEDVVEGYGGGRMLTAERAVEAGLADRVATFEETVSSLVGANSSPGRGARSTLSGQLASVVADANEATTRLAEVMAQRAAKGKRVGVASTEAAAELEASLSNLREVLASAGDHDTPESDSTWGEGLEIEDSLLRRSA